MINEIPRRYFSASLRREAVRRVRAGAALSEVAHDLGLSAERVKCWLSDCEQAEDALVKAAPMLDGSSPFSWRPVRDPESRH